MSAGLIWRRVSNSLSITNHVAEMHPVNSLVTYNYALSRVQRVLWKKMWLIIFLCIIFMDIIRIELIAGLIWCFFQRCMKSIVLGHCFYLFFSSFPNLLSLAIARTAVTSILNKDLSTAVKRTDLPSTSKCDSMNMEVGVYQSIKSFYWHRCITYNSKQNKNNTKKKQYN